MNLSSALFLLAHLVLAVYGSNLEKTAASRLNNKLFLFPPSLGEVFPYFHRPPGPHVPTVTLTSLTTVTTTDTTSVVCAKLVNVTGPCLRRRGAWVEEPIVLSFHGDFDDTFDLLYSPVLGVEPTVAPENSIVIEEARTNDDVVSASIAPTIHNDYEEYQRNHFPFHLFRFSRWFSSFLSQIVVSTKTVTKTKIVRESPTNTVIYQQTSTVSLTATVFNTVFIQRCTPSPFPFSLCRNRRLHEVWA